MTTWAGVALESLSFEAHAGRDAQGKASYGTEIAFVARAVQPSDRQGANVVRRGDGTEVRISLDVYVPASESAVPQEEDRVTHAGIPYIVVERRAVKGLAGVLHHTKLRCTGEL